MALAEQQAELVAALTGRGALPAGFDRTRIDAAADALAFKRMRAVAQAWPGVRASLGETFRDLFSAYAAGCLLPAQGGPLADGRAFVRYLASKGPLADTVRLHALEVDVRCRRTSQGLAPRRLPAVRLAWLRQSRTLAVAVGMDSGARLYRFALPRTSR